MKKKMYTAGLMAIIFSLTLVVGNALGSDVGDNDEYNQYSFGLHGGTIISFTDIKDRSPVFESDKLAFGGGLFFNYHQSPVLSFRGDLLYGNMKGVDSKEDRMFEARILHAMMTANVSLNGLVAPRSQSNKWMNFYGFTGFGVLFHSSEHTDLQGAVIRYPYAGTDPDEFHSAFAIPFGLGVNFRLSDRIDLGVRSSFYYLMSDELDAYVVPDSRQDMYNYTSVGLTFKLGRKERSKDWAPIPGTVYPGDVYRMDNMTDRITELEDKLETTEMTHAAGMEQIHGEIAGLALKQQELSRSNNELDESLKALSQRLIQYEARIGEMVEKAGTERYFSVQVLSSRAEISIEEVKSQLGIDYDIDLLYMDGWYKFLSGKYQDLEDAKLHMQRIWGQGIRDAFIVVYENGNLTPR